MKTTVGLIFLLLVGWAFPVKGHAFQPDSLPSQFSLSQATEYALRNSPVLLNSARDVEIAKKSVWESTSIGLPQANLSSSYTYSPTIAGLFSAFGDTTSPFGDMFQMSPEDLKTSFNMNFQVTQLIFSGQYLVGLKAAKVYASITNLANTKSKAGIIESLTDTYFAALIARQSKLILDSTYATLNKTLYETEQMYKQGFVESTDVDQFRILVFNIKSSLAVSERQIEITERLLKFQMGIPIDQTILLTDQIDPLMDRMKLEIFLIDSFDVEKNIDYQMLATREKLMGLNVKVKQSEFLPSLAGFYNHNWDFDDNFFNDQSPDMLGLSLSFPIWSSGQRLSRVGQARLAFEQAKTNRQMVMESLKIEFENTRSAFLSSLDIYTIQKENRDLALRIYNKSIIKYKEGVASSLDLKQTQQQYFQAESEYYGAMMGLVSAKSKLDNLFSEPIK